MQIKSRYGDRFLTLDVPAGSIVYEPGLPAATEAAAAIVLRACESPCGSDPLTDCLAARRPESVCLVVSDITRPIPYTSFLPQFLAVVEAAGIARDAITILIATGMHRPSTPDERRRMFGDDVCRCYRIVGHEADNEEDLVALDSPTVSGARVRVNRHYVQADFKILTGLVEPHFMAGFSGGRKAVCPGLVDLQTIRNFHGHQFLGAPAARNLNLHNNPCHDEAESVARIAGVDFTVNVILSDDRRVVNAFAGDLVAAHAAAVEKAREYTGVAVSREADLVVTGCGGAPLDTTFYQCVKGIVSCLPAVREGGRILAFGSCREGIGSAAYAELMKRYQHDHHEFLRDISAPNVFTKDQWQLQMQCRALHKVGRNRLFFATDAFDVPTASGLSVVPVVLQADAVEADLNRKLAGLAETSEIVAVIPDGPYCAPYC